jgi:hypothetical protein
MQGWSGLRTQAWTCGRGSDPRPEPGWSDSTGHWLRRSGIHRAGTYPVGCAAASRGVGQDLIISRERGSLFLEAAPQLAAGNGPAQRLRGCKPGQRQGSVTHRYGDCVDPSSLRRIHDR